MRFYVVILHGPLHVRCFTMDNGFTEDIARGMAAEWGRRLDGVAFLFKGRVERDHIRMWYRDHGRLSNHPGYHDWVPNVEKDRFEVAREKEASKFRCPICKGRRIAGLRGIDGRSQICEDCHWNWLELGSTGLTDRQWAKKERRSWDD